MDYYYVYSTSLALLSIIIITSLHFLFPTRKSKQSQLPPGPKPWPIIGNIHLLGNKPHQSVAKLSKIYGPVMSLKLGSITTIVISSPEVAKEMFLKHDLALSGRKVPCTSTVADHHKYSMVRLSVSPKWRNLRKIATIQLFTQQRLDSTQELRRKKVAELIDYVKECKERRIAIDIGKAVFITSLNLLSNTIFSIDMASYDDSSFSQEFKDLVRLILEEGAKPNVSDFFPTVRRLDLLGIRRRYKGALYKLLGIFDEIIDERLRDPMGFKDDVLGTLLKLVKENELSLEDVRHILPDLFVAGTDTTSSTLEWAMAELIRHPEKMKHAQLEINQIVGNDNWVQESDIQNLPYVQAIVKETFRLHPPAPFLIPRKAEEDVRLCNYNVPRDAQIWVNVWSIGRDPSVWVNPELFSPERFLERQIDVKGRDFELIPFGAGRRMCPGWTLAYRMVHLTLATLLHSFDWKLTADGLNPKDLDMDEKFGLALQKVQPLMVVPSS